jgi:hypothetical protein
MMRKNIQVTCNNCYFRSAGLCALPGDVPCPTFRAAAGHTLAPPLQAPLVARQLQPLVATSAAA